MNLGKTVGVENVVDIEIDNKVVTQAINDATAVEVTAVEAISVNA